MRENLVYPVKIKQIQDIKGKDFIKVLSFEGMDWEVISNIKETSFEVGDTVLYFEIDSMIPQLYKNKLTPFEFLRSRCLWKNKYFKIGAMKMAGVVSQGLVCPLSILDFYGVDKKNLKQDFTKLLGVEHYDEVSNPAQSKNIPKTKWQKFVYKFKKFFHIKTKHSKISFPIHLLPKTDEVRCENLGSALYDFLEKKDLDVTQKEDGQSITAIINDNIFWICSRNLVIYKDNLRKDLKPKKGNGSHIMQYAIDSNLKENILAIQKKLGHSNIAVQFELCGPGIQANKMGYKSLIGKYFNIIILGKKPEYLTYKEMARLEISTEFFHIVKLIYTGKNIFTCKKDLKELADKKYSNGYPMEGIVIRAADHAVLNDSSIRGIGDMFSFKCINDKFILKGTK